MAVATQEWLDLVEREYFCDFVTAGGAGVKFVTGESDQLTAVGDMLAKLSERHKLEYVPIDAATTKLHMIQDVFFAVARALDWDAMAQHFVEALFERQGYEWPRPGEPVPLDEVAERNSVDVTLMRRDFRRWLTAEVMRDAEMTQDFRVAITRLCLRRLEPEDSQPGITTPVLEWLRGELRRIGALKEASITAKITRHNGRAMLRSLCRWLQLCGWRGLCVTLDIRQLSKTGSAAGDGLRYSPAAVMDGFEVLRQLIDDEEHFTGLMLAVLADESLVGEDRRRSLDAYLALKMRIWDDVRPEDRDNPLAPLVKLAGQSAPASMEGTAAP
jgi:P-loop Domain of unknown function (DUF2791)